MKKTLIIAEAGVNHNGDLNLAKKLIEIAADSGLILLNFKVLKPKTVSAQRLKKHPISLKPRLVMRVSFKWSKTRTRS